jgi:hypothetical protein
MSRTYPLALNPSGTDESWKVAQVVNNLRRGKGANVQDLTLRPSQTTTVITDALITPVSHIELVPLTASARTALNSSYVSNRADGTATITHPSNAATDQRFTYCVVC